MVEGMVMNVMTSCSLRPASRARKPPMAWIPSCELPAMRITASEIFEILGEPPFEVAVTVESLMKRCLIQFKLLSLGADAVRNFRQEHRCPDTVPPWVNVSISYRQLYIAAFQCLTIISAVIFRN